MADENESPMAAAARQIQAERIAAEQGGQPDTTEKQQPVKTPDPNMDIRKLVDRIVRLEEEKRNLADDIKGIYQEAKSAGYAPKAVKIAVKREMETSEQRAAREAVEAEAALIIAALGEFVETPLGQAAAGRVGG